MLRHDTMPIKDNPPMPAPHMMEMRGLLSVVELLHEIKGHSIVEM
jgi:hypothetical protein